MGREEGVDTRGDLQEDTCPRCTPSSQGSVEFLPEFSGCVPRTYFSVVMVSEEGQSRLGMWIVRQMWRSVSTCLYSR